MAHSFHLSPKVQTDGTQSIRVDISHNGGRVRKVTGIAVSDRHWDQARQRVKLGDPRHSERNRKLEELSRKLEDTMDARPNITAEQVWEMVKRGGMTGDPLSKVLKEIATTHPGFAKGTRETLHLTVERVAQFIPEARIGTISVDDVKRFRMGLEGLGLGSNTVRMRLRMLRLLYNLAMDITGEPHTRAFIRQLPAEVQTMPRDLTLEQIHALAALQLDGGLALARDTWMLSLYLGGIRIGDLLKLTRADLHDGGLMYRATKTKAPRWVPIIPQARTIIERHSTGSFLLPWLESRTSASSNAKINEYLKVVGAKAGCPDGLSMHWARHSCASYLLNLQIPLDVVQMILGHARIQQTIDYAAKFDRKRVAEAMHKVGEAVAQATEVA